MINGDFRDIFHIMVNFLFGGIMKLILPIKVIKSGMMFFHNILQHLIYKVKLKLIRAMILACLRICFNLNGNLFIQGIIIHLHFLNLRIPGQIKIFL